MNASIILGVIVGSALLSGSFVAASIRVAHHYGYYDHPDGERKTQEQPIPKLGGAAVAVAFSIATVAVLLASNRPRESCLALGAVVPALGAAVVGYADDRRNLNPYLRLVLQASLALLAWALGTRVYVTGFVWLDAAILVLWILVVVNGMNLLDNSDGLAGSTILVSALGASIIAVMYGQILVSLLGFALVGVCIGFLWHNWFPARVYMGDSGAYFLALLLALLTIRLKPAEAPAGIGILIAVLLVLLPIVDTAYVTIKRLRAGIHPFTAGRDHLSHVIQASGASVPTSVAVLQVLLVVSVIAALVLARLYIA